MPLATACRLPAADPSPLQHQGIILWQSFRQGMLSVRVAPIALPTQRLRITSPSRCQSLPDRSLGGLHALDLEGTR